MQRKCRIVIVIDISDGDKHQQINDCSGSRAMFGKYRKVLWMMPITCSEPGRPWHELEVPACQNLDIAGWVCNFLPFRGCTTLHNMVQVPKRLLYKCWWVTPLKMTILDLLLLNMTIFFGQDLATAMYIISTNTPWYHCGTPITWNYQIHSWFCLKIHMNKVW